MLQISIPKPCHKDWAKMTPTSKGSFCQSCSKEVIDFTHMNDDAVQNYFLDKTTEKTCGHFLKSQIKRIQIELPATIFNYKTCNWKQYMAIILLAFGSMLFSCDVKTTEPTTGQVLIKVQKDTIAEKALYEPMMGKIAQPIPLKNEKAINNRQEMITGDIAFIPSDSSAKIIGDSIISQKSDNDSKFPNVTLVKDSLNLNL